MSDQAKILWTITWMCLNPKSLQEPLKSYPTLRNLAPKIIFNVPMIWKVMRRNLWSDIVNWRTKQLNNYTKSQHRAWMTTILKTKKMGSVGELSNICSHIVFKCFLWRELVDLMLVLSLNGPKLVTNAKHFGSHTFITHVI